MKVERISPSQINTLNKCGEQYRRRYVMGEKKPPGLYQIRGSSVHKPVELNLINKMQTGELLPIEQVRAIAADEVSAHLQGEYLLDGDYAEMGKDAARGFVKDEAVSLAGLHAEQVAPRITPTAIEMKVELAPSEPLPVTLVGVLDVVDGDRIVRDTKTAAKSPNADAAHVSEQLTTYDLLFRAKYGKAPEKLVLDTLVRTPKKGELKVVQLDTTRTIQDLEMFVRRANVAIRSIATEVFLPAPVDSWACSPSWCAYWEDCPFAARGRVRHKS